MKAEAILKELLRTSPTLFRASPTWQQCGLLNKIASKWEKIGRASTAQSGKWRERYWELSEVFIDRWVSEIEQKERLGKSTKPPVSQTMVLERLHQICPERTSKLMYKYPKAFALVDDEWALWARIIV